MGTKIIIGLLVGLVCGIVPFCIGFLLKNRPGGIIGGVVSLSSGVLFSTLDKPPFTALFVAALFVLIIAHHKRVSKR